MSMLFFGVVKPRALGGIYHTFPGINCRNLGIYLFRTLMTKFTSRDSH